MSHEVRFERDSSVADIFVGELQDLHTQRDTLRGCARISCYREIDRRNSESYLIRFFLSLGLIDEKSRKRLWEYQTRTGDNVIASENPGPLNYRTALKIKALEEGAELDDSFIQTVFGHLEKRINFLYKLPTFAN